MLTRRHVFQVAAGLAGSVAGARALPAEAAPAVAEILPAIMPAAPFPPDPSEAGFITADAIMQTFRRYILLDCLEATNERETCAHPNETITFSFDRPNGCVDARGPGWEMRVSAGVAPLPVVFAGRPTRAAGYAFLMVATEFLERT